MEDARNLLTHQHAHTQGHDTSAHQNAKVASEDLKMDVNK